MIPKKNVKEEREREGEERREGEREKEKRGREMKRERKRGRERRGKEMERKREQGLRSCLAYCQPNLIPGITYGLLSTSRHDFLSIAKDALSTPHTSQCKRKPLKTPSPNPFFLTKIQQLILN